MPAHAPLSHLELVRTARRLRRSPRRPRTRIAKLAAGAADNLLTAAALACRRPLVVAPAMNDAMYEHPATQANLATLRERGATVLEPGTGALGSPGEWGIGRLPEPPALLAAVEQVLAPGDLDGLQLLVTAGGTREPIDAVRFIGNRSSGRMGFALAERAARRGAQVTVVAANVALPRAPGVAYVDVATAAELKAACERAPSPPATSCSWPPPSPTTGPPSAARTRSRRTPRALRPCSSSSAPTTCSRGSRPPGAPSRC